MQGLVFRQDDARFAGLDAGMANRKQGSGTRILINRRLGTARPDG